MKNVVEQFINRVRIIYNVWDLRLMVLLTLSVQILLVFFGARRKFTSKIWIRGIIWSSYISADSLAILALGMLSSKILKNDTEKSSSIKIDDNTRLLAFWSPCLLLLLSGPDSITAYALEDNELWLRHLIGLVMQTVGAVYIYVLAWSFSYLSLMSVLMLAAAIIKYGEKVWVLRQASSVNLKESMLSKENLHSYELTTRRPSTDRSPTLSDADELRMASDFFRGSKGFFVDFIVRYDAQHIKRIFSDNVVMTCEKAFKIIEIELGFMYDLLYTKAIVLLKHWGLYRRIITTVISCIVLILFAVSHKPHYPTLDLIATFLLLSTIICIEIYSVIMLMASDWVGVWMSNDTITSSFIRYVVAFIQKRFRQPRWSDSVGQLSFFSFSIKDQTLPCSSILKLLSLDDKLDTVIHTRQKKVTHYIKEQIWNGIQLNPPDCDFSDHNQLWNHVLQNTEYSRRGSSNSRILERATTFEFDHAILVWHIATELCYYSDEHVPQDMVEPRKAAKLVSRYMYYLLLQYPFMLPTGIGQIRHCDTLTVALRFFKERGLNSADPDRHGGYCNWLHCFCSQKNTKERRQEQRKRAVQLLLQASFNELEEDIHKEEPHTRGVSALFDACTLGKELMDNADPSNRWVLILRSLVVLMYSAAYRCRGGIHAQQLRRGGELLSHVWMMMTHFGIFNCPQIRESNILRKIRAHAQAIRAAHLFGP